MSEGQHRITALTSAPGCAPEWGHGDVVATVTSFRSNYSANHYVVGFNSGTESDLSPMGYVDRQAAVDLVNHFVEVANELGADLELRTGEYLTKLQSATFENGYSAGRDGEAEWRNRTRAAVAALLREARRLEQLDYE